MNRSQLWGMTLALGALVFTGALGTNINSSLLAAAASNAVQVAFPIMVSDQNSGAEWSAGMIKTIKWSFANYRGAIGISLQNYSGGWSAVASTSNSGSYNWVLPYTFKPGNDYYVRVSAMDGGGNIARDANGNLITGVSKTFAIGTSTSTVQSGTKPASDSRKPISFSVRSYLSTTTAQSVVAGVEQIIGGFTVSSSDLVKGDKITFKISVSGKGASIADISSISLYAVSGGVTGLVSGPVASVNSDGTVSSFFAFFGVPGVSSYLIKANLSPNFKDGQRITVSANPYKDDWQLVAADGSPRAVMVSKNSLQMSPVTIRSGQIIVSTATSSPAYELVAGGSNNVVVGDLRFQAIGEPVNLQRLVLKFESGYNGDLGTVHIFDGGTEVGQALFVGSDSVATSTLATPVLIQKDGSKVLTVRADFGSVCASCGTNESGHVVKVAFNGADKTGTYGHGMLSGMNIYATGSSNFSGARLMRSYPIIAPDNMPSNAVADGRLMRFSVNAGSEGNVGLSRLTLRINANKASVSNINVFAYADYTYSQPALGAGLGGKLLLKDAFPGTHISSATIPIQIENVDGIPTALEVPAGSTRYFEVRSTVTASSGATNYYVNTSLLGDSSSSKMGIGFKSGSNFVWSPNSTTTSLLTDTDWTNGFAVPGLPAIGLSQTRTN